MASYVKCASKRCGYIGLEREFEDGGCPECGFNGYFPIKVKEEA